MRLLNKLSSKVDILTAEVKSLKAENTFMRAEIGLLGRRVLEGLRPAPKPQASFTTIVDDAERMRRAASSAGRPTPASGAVPKTAWNKGTAATSAIPLVNAADDAVGDLSARDAADRRNTGQADAALDDDGFTLVKRKKRAFVSSGTAKSDKVFAVTRQPYTKGLFVSRLDPKTSAADIENLIAPFLDEKRASVTKLQPKFDSYSSFHLAGDYSVFDILNKAEVWPEGSIFLQFFLAN